MPTEHKRHIERFGVTNAAVQGLLDEAGSDDDDEEVGPIKTCINVRSATAVFIRLLTFMRNMDTLSSEQHNLSCELTEEYF